MDFILCVPIESCITSMIHIPVALYHVSHFVLPWKSVSLPM
jgi:hypothetical protein